MTSLTISEQISQNPTIVAMVDNRRKEAERQILELDTPDENFEN